MFSPYRGRSHIKKQRNSKNKITLTERKLRAARKKLEKIFPNYIIYHPFYTNHLSKPHPSPQGEGQGVRYQHSISITKKRIAV